MWGLGQDTLLGIVVGLCGAYGRHISLGIVVGLCGASGNTVHWVLLLVYVGPRATHLTGYCWFMWHLGQHILLGIVVGLGLCGVLLLVMLRLGNTHYWLLLLVYEGPLPTHFTEYCCGLCEVSGNTLYWASLGLMWAAFINGFKIICKKKNSGKVKVSVSVY
jgi:hypothetical protein